MWTNYKDKLREFMGMFWGPLFIKEQTQNIAQSSENFKSGFTLIKYFLYFIGAWLIYRQFKK